MNHFGNRIKFWLPSRFTSELVYAADLDTSEAVKQHMKQLRVAVVFRLMSPPFYGGTSKPDTTTAKQVHGHHLQPICNLRLRNPPIHWLTSSRNSSVVLLPKTQVTGPRDSVDHLLTTSAAQQPKVGGMFLSISCWE